MNKFNTVKNLFTSFVLTLTFLSFTAYAGGDNGGNPDDNNSLSDKKAPDGKKMGGESGGVD